MIRQLAELMKGEGLASRARRGSAFTVFDFLGTNILRLASNLMLTRLLFPEAFGLMALVQVVTGAVQMFSDIGINASLVQHKRGDEPDFINTAWTLQVLRGLVLWLIIVALSPLAARFYEEPMLAQLLPVAGLSALIAGFMPTRMITANRHLILGRVTALSLGNQVINIGITVGLAWWLQSVWAIVFGILAGGILRNITTRLFMSGIPNRFHFERSAARDLINVGKFILIGTFAGFLVQNADRAILGKFIPVDLLGVYVIALTLALVPNQMMLTLTWKIVHPLYSRKPPHESESNRRKINRARFGLTGMVFAGSTILILIGDPLVRALYPANFHDAGAMTVLIAIGFLPALVVISYFPVLLAAGRSGLHALTVSMQATLTVTALYIGISTFGIPGAALAPIVSTAIYYPVIVSMIRRYSAWDPVHDFVFFVLAAVITASAWWLHRDLLATIPTG